MLGLKLGNTIVLDAALGAASNIPFPVKASAAFTGGGTVDVTIGAAVADANTAIFLNSLRVFGLSRNGSDTDPVTVLQNIEQALVRAQRIMGVLGDGSFTVPDTGSQD